MMCVLLESVIMPNALIVAMAIAAPVLFNITNRLQVIATSFTGDLLCVVGLFDNIIAKNAELSSLSLESFFDILKVV